jgi:hypothetical protein
MQDDQQSNTGMPAADDQGGQAQDQNPTQPSGGTDMPPTGAPASETGVPSETPGAPATEDPGTGGGVPSEPSAPAEGDQSSTTQG